MKLHGAFFAAVLFGIAPNLLAGPLLARQMGESIVMVGREPVKLAFAPAPGQAVQVRSTYLPGLKTTILYKPGSDYTVTPDGQLRRTPKSRIPDYSKNDVYGLKLFDHLAHPGYGNGKFFAYVDYSYAKPWAAKPPLPGLGAEALAGVHAKLLAGKKVTLVAFGDSVTAGAESTAPELAYWARWAQQLRSKYPKASIEGLNSGVGGDLSDDGLARLDAGVIAKKPDLVIIAFGLNDFNRGPVELKLDKWASRRAKWARSWAKFRDQPPPVQKNRLERPEYFAMNLRTMVDRVKKETGADVILVSALQPNPNWKYSDGEMAALAAATQGVAREKGCAYVDVFHTWAEFSGMKKPEDLLANNANHPNDFGHWIYLQALSALNL